MDLWPELRNQIVKKVLLEVGVSAISPWGKAIVYIAEKLLDKFVKPFYDQGVALGIREWVKAFETKKLKELDDAISNQDRDTVIDILDSLK